MNVSTRRAAAATAILLLPACSSAVGGGSNAVPNTATARSITQKLAVKSKHLVYVSSQSSNNGVVDVYSVRGQGQAPIASITNGISSPNGLAVDSVGNLYVANSGNSTVTVYPPGATSPSTTYSDGISAPFGVAVGSDGTVYVANETGNGSSGGTVTEYPAGSTTPSTTISLPQEYAFTVALDSSNALYVSWFSLSSYTISIYKYPTEGSSTGSDLDLDLPSGAFPAYAIAFDHRGNLVVPYEPLTHYPPKYLALFPPGATKPKRKIAYGDLFDVVSGLAFPKESSTLFYVAGENAHDWLKLTYPKHIPRDVVNVGVPTGLALSP